MQDVIDVYAEERGETKTHVAQCKLAEYLGPRQVLKIIETFMKGNLVEDTKEFILCTNGDLSKLRDEKETISKARNKLLAFDIDFIVWDERGLSTFLRNNATPEFLNIVYRYFTEEIALAFYGREIWLDYVRTLRKVRKRRYPIYTEYIERRIISYSDQIESKRRSTWNAGHGWYNQPNLTLTELLEKSIGEDSKKIVLLSTAGFGKTEELKNCAGYFSAEEKLLYPIKFSLQDYEGETVEEIVSRYDSDWKNILEEHILLVFDGLDEIAEHHMQTFFRHLNAFAELHANIQAVVSSRYNFYDVRYSPLREFHIYLHDH